MVSASPNDQKYPRYPLVLKLNVTLARPLRLIILYFLKWKILSDDRRLYLHDSKWNSRSDVDGLTHTKQLLNLLCIVYLKLWQPFCTVGLKVLSILSPSHNFCIPGVSSVKNDILRDCRSRWQCTRICHDWFWSQTSANGFLEVTGRIIWAVTRQNRSSGFPTMGDSNQSPKLQRPIARKWKFCS